VVRTAGLYGEARRFVGSLRYSGATRGAERVLTNLDDRSAAKATGFSGESERARAYSEVGFTLIE